MDKGKFSRPIENVSSKLKREDKNNDFWDFWLPLVVTIAFYSGIRSYIAEARYIPSGSMLPTLQIKDRLLVEKITYKKRSPERGEIVVFNSPYSFDKELVKQRSTKIPSKALCSFLTFPLISALPGLGDPACNAYIKRIVAIGGDYVFVDSSGKVFVNGKSTKEVYASNYCPITTTGISSCKRINTLVPDSMVIVLGDNRGNSWDSRYWPGGPFLPEKEIIGRAVWKFWPINRMGSLLLLDHN